VPPYRETRNYVKQIANITKTTTRPIEVRSGQIYKVTELVDGREIVRYTDRKPTTGEYQTVGGR
jgi:preprotein translocase subunit Sss1